MQRIDVLLLAGGLVLLSGCPDPEPTLGPCDAVWFQVENNYSEAVLVGMSGGAFCTDAGDPTTSLTVPVSDGGNFPYLTSSPAVGDVVDFTASGSDGLPVAMASCTVSQAGLDLEYVRVELQPSGEFRCTCGTEEFASDPDAYPCE